MPTNVPPLRWQAFHTHKRGNAADEYEDAFAGNPTKGRFAVADGASESSFVATWAKLLAEGFVAAGRRPWRELDWLGPARQRWAADVDPRPLPWYAEEKREQGAYATFLGIAFSKTRRGASGRARPRGAWQREGGIWCALAVGDSCLCRLRAGKLRQSFPLKQSSDFGNHPALLGSRGWPADTPPQGIRRARGKWRSGDRFLLLTDALAEWMLRRTEQNQQPADDIDPLLGQFGAQDVFAAWVAERRDRQGLRNDDVTLLVVDL
jgi:hypothetical protein